MSDSPQAIWWVFILGVLATAIVLVGMVGSLVFSQRRYLKLYRTHARKVLEAQEAERARVAREVHDDALARLTLIDKDCGRVGEVIEGVAPEQAGQLAAVRVEVEDLKQFLRGVAHRLHPALIDRGGLRPALLGLGQELEQGFGITVAFDLPPGPAHFGLSPANALVLFRIAQEALHNVVRHAGVSAVSVRLRLVESGLELTIRDEGRGFAADRAPVQGIGLIGMSERAQLAEGWVQVESRMSKGTTVRVWVPTGNGGVQ